MKRKLLILAVLLCAAIAFAGTNPSVWYAGNLLNYDATVCSSGCDYTSIATAVAALSSRDRLYIKGGTYTENDIEFTQSDVLVHFGGPTTINLNSDMWVTLDGVDNVTVVCDGTLTLSGEGETTDAAGYWTLLHTDSSSYDLDFSRCPIRLIPTLSSYASTVNTVDLSSEYTKMDLTIKDYSFSFSANSASDNLIHIAYSDYSEFKITMENIQKTCTGYTDIVSRNLRVYDTDYCKFDITIENVDTIGGVGSGYALVIEGATAGYSTYDVTVRNCTGSGFGTTGVSIVGSDYVSVFGTSRDNSTNLTNTGTGNKTGELAV